VYAPSAEIDFYGTANTIVHAVVARTVSFQGDHTIAIDDHLVVGNRLPDLTAQTLYQFACFVIVFAGEAGVHRASHSETKTGAHCTPHTSDLFPSPTRFSPSPACGRGLG